MLEPVLKEFRELNPAVRARPRVTLSHVPALDGVRGVAVLAVFIFHFGGGSRSGNVAVRIVGHIVRLGWAGVTLFFVLSGFLITGILWDTLHRAHWWRDFYARRALRIFPLYYGALLLVLAGAAWAGTLRAARGSIWIPALFLQNFPHLSDRSGSIASPLAIFHFWSLAVEEQFYLLWPFLLYLQRSLRKAFWLCLGVFVISELFRVVVWTTFSAPRPYWQFILSRAGELAVGGALAMLYRSPRWTSAQRWLPALAWVSLAATILACVWAGTADATAGPIGMLVLLPSIAVLAVAFVALCLRPGIVQRVASLSVLRWLGSLSYGIYVFHILFSHVFSRLAAKIVLQSSGNTFYLAQLIVNLAGSISVAWVSFHFFETPFLRLKRRFSAAE